MMFVCEVGGGVVMPRSIEIGRGFGRCTAAQGYSQIQQYLTYPDTYIPQN